MRLRYRNSEHRLHSVQTLLKSVLITLKFETTKLLEKLLQVIGISSEAVTICHCSKISLSRRSEFSPTKKNQHLLAKYMEQ